jgi:prepilin-type N-terminal cleavage/methylation domain-containing protein
MKKKAFTLIELLAVILILSILFALLTPAIRRSVATARSRQADANKVSLRAALRAYRHEYRKWPLAMGDESINLGQSSNEVKYSTENYKVLDRMKNDNPMEMKFVNESDYQFDKNKNVINPVTSAPYTFVFDLGNDNCRVE